jgi:3-deoxy-D-manno-octulosonic-acid transferase
MNRGLYNLALAALLPVALPYFEWRARRQTGRGDVWAERFGFIHRRPDEDLPPIWIHAASVGEVQAALPLLRSLGDSIPERGLVVTSFTAAGADRLHHAAGDSVIHYLLPYDLPGPVRRFLDRVRPAALLVMETELWPNLFRQTAARGIPVVLGSARLSDKSMRRYRRIGALVRETLDHVTLIAAQTEADAERFRALGAAADRVETLGNVKFDLTASRSVAEQGMGLRRMLFADRAIWLAASTRAGEEEKVLDAFEQVHAQRPDALLVIAPRHPERAGSVRQLARARGFGVVMRSDNRAAEADEAIFVLDTLGELSNFYAAGDVAFVGGSLVPVGGHNLLEPVALGQPVLTGPYNHNAPDIADQLIEAGAVRRVNNADQLASRVLEFFNDRDARVAAAQAGWQVIEDNRGAVERIVGRVARLLQGEASPARPGIRR